MVDAALNPFPFSRACHKQKHTNVVFMFSVFFFFFSLGIRMEIQH